MTVFAIILGILMIICGISCIFTPLLTFLGAVNLIVIIITVFGVLGIINGISRKRFGVSFVFSILSVLFGIAVFFFPNLMVLTDVLLIYLAAGWFVLQGIVSIFTAVKVTKAAGSSLWIFQLIMGILSILLGCYSFFRPTFAASVSGILIGFYFIEAGLVMLLSASHSE